MMPQYNTFLDLKAFEPKDQYKRRCPALIVDKKKITHVATVDFICIHNPPNPHTSPLCNTFLLPACIFPLHQSESLC